MLEQPFNKCFVRVRGDHGEKVGLAKRYSSFQHMYRLLKNVLKGRLFFLFFDCAELEHFFSELV